MILGGLRKLSVAMAVSALLGVALFAPPQAQAQGKLSFSFATGGTGGVWYPLGGAIGGVVGKKGKLAVISHSAGTQLAITLLGATYR